MLSKKIKMIIASAFCLVSIGVGFLYATVDKTHNVSEAHNHDAEAHNHVHENSMFTPNVLLTKNRDKTVVCIEDYTTSPVKLSSLELQGKLQEAMSKVKTNEKWEKSGLSAFDVEVKTACSITPLLIDPAAGHPVYSGKNSTPRFVKTPSTEILGIFIVDEEIINKHFKDTPTRWSPEQVLCEGDECNEVTRGLYLTYEELKNGKLQNEIVYGLGIESIKKSTNAQKEREKQEVLKKQEEVRNKRQETSYSP